MTDPPATNTVRHLADAVDSIDPATPLDEVLAFEDRVSFFKAFIKELDQTLKKRLYEWIEVNGEINLPEMNKCYRNGTITKVKCRNNMATLTTLLDLSGGDMETLVKCLASNAFKQGECKIHLKDKWGDHFDTTLVPDVKTGVAKRETKKIDTTFIPKKGK